MSFGIFIPPFSLFCSGEVELGVGDVFAGAVEFVLFCSFEDLEQAVAKRINSAKVFEVFMIFYDYNLAPPRDKYKLEMLGLKAYRYARPAFQHAQKLGVKEGRPDSGRAASKPPPEPSRRSRRAELLLCVISMLLLSYPSNSGFSQNM